MKNYNIKFNAATSVGGREMNQDVFFANNVISDADTTKDQYFEDVFSCSNGDISVFAVCDGIGSYKNSGFAAHAALTKIRDLVEEYKICFNSEETKNDVEENTADVSQNEISADEDTKEDKIDLKAWVFYALNEGKQAMLRFCREKGCNGESSTIAMLVFRNDEYIFANIGDSPCYFRDATGNFKELSFKHNLANYKRLMNVEYAESDERVLLHHFGDKSNEIMLTANIVSGKIDHKDAFIICSDGVATTLGVDVVNKMLSEQQPSYKYVTEAAKVQDADNCTAITIYIEAADSGVGDVQAQAEDVQQSAD